ncbi:DUF4365 domain-containing protein [Mucilaginibacter sp.]
MTRRNPNTKIEFQGVRYVQGVVQDNHCIFEPFSRENDQGNDCLIEFVKDGLATNYGVYVQIKSGTSYKDNSGYKIPTDQAHLKYWNQGINLTIGIVYDPKLERAFWVNITAYLKRNPQVLQQNHHAIRIETSNEFSLSSFDFFMQYCIAYKEEYTNYENYGRSLEWLANMDNPNICYEGLKSLYSNHRGKEATWYYILSSFAGIKEEGIRRNILGLISNCIYNADVLWHSSNMQYMPTKTTEATMSKLLTNIWDTTEIKLSISFMLQGINRGNFSYQVFSVINLIQNIHLLLKEIAFQANLDSDFRNFCFWLYMQIAKFHSVEETLKVADLYLSLYPFAYEDEALVGVKESIEMGLLVPVG